MKRMMLGILAAAVMSLGAGSAVAQEIASPALAKVVERKSDDSQIADAKNYVNDALSSAETAAYYDVLKSRLKVKIEKVEAVADAAYRKAESLFSEKAVSSIVRSTVDTVTLSA